MRKQASQIKFSIVLLLIGIMILAFIGPASAGETEARDVNETHPNNTDEIISNELQEANSEIEILVSLEGVEKKRLANSDNQTRLLQTIAEQRQQPLKQYAKKTNGVVVKESFWIGNAMLVSIDLDQASLRELAEQESVSRIEPDRIQAAGSSTRTQSDSTNPDTKQSTDTQKQVETDESRTFTDALQTIEADKAWNEFDTRGEGATIGVIDSGVDPESHPDLKPIEGGYFSGGWRDFINDREEPYDVDGHGTAVAGIAAGGQTEEGDFYGVAPEANLIVAQVATKSTSSDLDVGHSKSAKLDALEWFSEHESDVDVVVIASGSAGTDFSYDYDDADIAPVRNIKQQGIMIVSSAGNEGQGTSGTPANVPDAFSVGATDGRGSIAEYSSGEKINTKEAWGRSAAQKYDWPDQYIVPDVAAPGTGSVTAAKGGGYTEFAGTSAAAPYVAGTAALMQSASDEDLEPEEIEEALRSTADHPQDYNREDAQDTRYGHGVINAYEAIDKVAEEKPTIIDKKPRHTVLSEEEGRHQFKINLKNIGNYTETREIEWLLRSDANVTGLNESERLDAYESEVILDSGRKTVTLEPGEETTMSVIAENKSLNSVDEVTWRVAPLDSRSYGNIMLVDMALSAPFSLDNNKIANKTDTIANQSGTDVNSTNRDNQTENKTPSSGLTDTIPGFGVGGAVVSIIGGGYLLKCRQK